MRVTRLFLGLLFGCGFALLGAPTKYDLSAPQFGAVGTPFPVRISSAEPLDPIQLPPIPGARWQNARRQMVRSINGETTYTTTFFLIPERQGRLTIPAKVFTVDGVSFPAEPVVVDVTSTPSASVPAPAPGRSSGKAAPAPSSAGDGESIPIAQAVFGRIQLPDRSEFYTGEEFRMVYQLFIREGVGIRNVEYPRPAGVEDLLFANLSVLPENRSRRSRDPRFDTPFTRDEFVKGERYRVLNFIAFCRGVRPGTVRPGGSISVQLIQQDRSEEDLFGGFGFFGSQRLVPYTAEFSCPVPVSIHPLPPPPAEGSFSGLVGNWKLNAKLEPDSTAVGEPVELILSAEGEGSGEPFRVPDLKFPGFRAYPPKETRTFGKITVKYVLVPLKQGEAALDFAVSVFDPKPKEYKMNRFALKLPVRAGVVTPGAAAAAPAPAPAPEERAVSATPVRKVKKNVSREELFYLKADRGQPVLVPLMENQGRLFRLCVFLGPVLGILLFGLLRRRARRAADPSIGKRQERRRMLPELLKALKRPEPPDAELRRRMLDVLAEALTLPPGASASEIGEAAAARVKDPEVRQAVEELESASFLPGGSALSDAARRKLHALLKKLCLWALILLPFAGIGAENYNAAYESGAFPEAVKHYRRDVASGKVSPNALYNLGGTFARMDDLPRARLCFLQAHLLRPSDREITANLEWVNRKLLQPPLYGDAGPAALLREYRDLLRPDQYLLIAAGLFLLLCLTLGAAPVLSRKALLQTAGALSILLLLAAGCAWAQVRGPYRSDEAVVTAEALKLYTLPGTGGREAASIPGGSSASVLDRRGDWVRVSANGQEGWAERSGLGMVFPWGVFAPEQER